MPRLEAIYVVEFGDFMSLGGYRNIGVAILEEGKVYGGDSGYYYIGEFAVQGNQLSAAVRIVKHDPNFVHIFGEPDTSYVVKIIGIIHNGIIQGSMERTDKAGLRLPVRLIWKEDLLLNTPKPDTSPG